MEKSSVPYRITRLHRTFSVNKCQGADQHAHDAHTWHRYHSRSLALGAVDVQVTGFEGETNLKDFGYDKEHYSHSREFRSNIVDEWEFWKRVALDFDVTSNLPEN